MRYLMREAAPLSVGQWEKIDQTVVAEAKNTLVGRRFLSLHGPLGAQTQLVPIDFTNIPPAAMVDFWGQEEGETVRVKTREFVELATIYSDFLISWRDIEDESRAGLQSALEASAQCARREDDLVFHGDKALGREGLLTAKGAVKLPLSDWSKGENPVADVSKAIEELVARGYTGTRAMIVSNDLYGMLHRIQPGTGTMEIDRVRKLVDGGFHRCSRLEKKKAVLVYCDPQNMDLAIGQDLVTAYMGNVQMDHAFRVMETAALRIKRPSSIAVLG